MSEFIPLYKELQLAWEGFFNMTKKWHDLFHLAQRSSEVNPAITSCMLQEDLMGKIKTIVKQSVQASRPLTATTKTMVKYRLGIHLEHCRV